MMCQARCKQFIILTHILDSETEVFSKASVNPKCSLAAFPAPFATHFLEPSVPSDASSPAGQSVFILLPLLRS